MIKECKKNKLAKSGFSIVEIAIAMMVFVVLVIGTASVLYMTGGSIVKQGHARAAMLLANNAMEAALRSKFSTLSDSTDTYTDDGVTYTIQTEITTLTVPSLRHHIVVRVSYRDGEVTTESILIEGLGVN